MRLRRLLLAPAAVMVLVACGDDDSSSTTTTAPVATTTAPPATSAPSSTTASATTVAPTTAAPTTVTPTTAATTTPAVREIVVDADTAAAAPLAETVPLGQQVRIVVRTATAQEFHLHGYDIDGSGTEVVFDFTADLPGEFELESHDTEDLLLTLTVT
jgi:hypothetical protein